MKDSKELLKIIPGLISYETFQSGLINYLKVKYTGKAHKFKPFIIDAFKLTWVYDDEEFSYYSINHK